MRQVLLPLWNVWYFFTLYANADGLRGARRRTDSTHLLDRYVLAKTGELVADVHARRWTRTTSPAPARSVRSYLDALTNWYVRRSRDRFWAGDADAFDTLYTVLETLCRVVAPLAPLTAEEIWRGLTGERSVHLTDWPSADGAARPTTTLVAAMDAVRDVVLGGAVAAQGHGPAGAAAAAVADRGDAATPTRCAPFADLVADEVNVKDVRLLGPTAGAAELCVTQVLTVMPRALGPRLGGQVQQVIKAVKAGDWSRGRDGVGRRRRRRAAPTASTS